MDPRLDPPPGVAVRAIARLASWLLPVPAARPAVEEIRSVLVVRTDDRVGNALLTIPLVRALQRALPQARVDLLLAAGRARVAEGLPDLDVVRFDKRAGPLRYLRFLRRLRARYDVVIDAAHWHAFSLTSALLSRWAARRWVIGADRGPAEVVYAGVSELPPPGTFEVAAKMLLAWPLGLRLLAPPLETALGRGVSPVEGRFAALNPGARKQDHRWPASRFGTFTRRLRRNNLPALGRALLDPLHDRLRRGTRRGRRRGHLRRAACRERQVLRGQASPPPRAFLAGAGAGEDHQGADQPGRGRGVRAARSGRGARCGAARGSRAGRGLREGVPGAEGFARAGRRADRPGP